MPLYVAGSASGIPDGGDPGQVLTLDEDLNPTWGETDPGKFRGAWAEDEVVGIYAFDEGIVPPFTAAQVNTGVMPFIDSSSLPSNGLYTSAVHLRAPAAYADNRSTVTLDMSSFTGVSITRMKYWRRFDNTGGFDWTGRFSIHVDGVMQSGSTYSDDQTWYQVAQALPPSPDAVSFVVDIQPGRDGYGSTPGARITGVEIYGTTRPYMLGEFVTHQGKMWESLTNNNSHEPSESSAAWDLAIVLPRPSGTTAQRPDPATAGIGYPYYDMTLNKPIWSDGTGWRDATGTVI